MRVWNIRFLQVSGLLILTIVFGLSGCARTVQQNIVVAAHLPQDVALKYLQEHTGKVRGFECQYYANGISGQDFWGNRIGPIPYDQLRIAVAGTVLMKSRIDVRTKSATLCLPMERINSSNPDINAQIQADMKKAVTALVSLGVKYESEFKKK